MEELKHKVIRQPLTIKDERRGIQGIFLIPSQGGDTDCGDVVIHELKDYYQIVKGKITDYLDLSVIVFYFISSNYFFDDKPFIINEKLERFARNEPYGNIVEQLKPFFI